MLPALRFHVKTKEGGTMTNATKAVIIAAINEVLGLVVAFGVTLSDAQEVAIVGTVNALLGLYVIATYRASPKRIAD